MDPSDFILPDICTQQQSFPQGTKRGRSGVSLDRTVDQVPDQQQQEEDLMWIDKYEPQIESQVGVSTTSLKKLKYAFEHSALQDGITKLLVLTGPTGSGKSTLVNVLCKQYGYEITEWFTPDRVWAKEKGYMEVFRKFMLQATYLNTLDSIDRPNNGRVILLDDLPDLTTDAAKNEFYSILLDCLNVRHQFLIVIIATDSYMETEDRSSSSNGYSRLLAADEFKFDRRVQFIDFNAIPNTLMKKVLNNIVKREKVQVPNSQMENLIDNSNGDIRLAINSLQFFSNSSRGAPTQPLPRKRRNKKGEVIVDFFRYTGHLSLFHAIGKVLYAKRNVDGTFESSPEHIINKTPKGNDTFIDYLHQNCVEFFANIEDCSKALEELSEADILRSEIDWQDSVGGLYRNYVSINGIMKNRRERKEGLWRELAGPMFTDLRYDLLKRKREEYNKTWMESVSLRSKQYEESHPEINTSIDDPVEAFSSDEDGFDDIFGDGSELADLDF